MALRPAGQLFLPDSIKNHIADDHYPCKAKSCQQTDCRLRQGTQIHLPLGGNDGFDVVGLLQGFQSHIIVDHQQNMFQISPGKSVFGYLADTAIFGIAAKQPGQHRTDLALPSPPLPLIAIIFCAAVLGIRQ